MKYNYRIYCFIGTVDATDIRDALRKSLDDYLRDVDPPYLDNTWANVEIHVEMID